MENEYTKAKTLEVTADDLYKDLSGKAGDHVNDVNVLMSLLHNLHVAKERVYNLSFCRRGLVGVWMNLARKYDRIDAMSCSEDYRNFTYIDTLFDTAAYALKMVDILRKMYPEAFDKWLENVYCEYTGHSITHVRKILNGDGNEQR